MKFQEHGSFTVTVDGQIVLVSVSGPYNDELARKHARVVHPLFSELKKKGPWVEIVTLTGSALFTPEAADVHRKGIRDAVDQGLTYAVLVIPPGIEGRDVAIYTLREIFEPHCRIKVFSKLESALSFAREYLSSSSS